MPLHVRPEAISFDLLSGAASGLKLLQPGIASIFLPSNSLTWSELSQRRAAHTKPILPLVDALAAQQELWGAGTKSVENARSLADANTFCVIAGQQPGFLLGPIYTLYKALTAVALARKIETETPGIRVVPIFWNASDDADLNEVSSAWLLDGQGSPTRFDLDFNSQPEGTWIGALQGGVVDNAALRHWLESSLPRTDFLPSILSMIDDFYRPQKRFAESFNRLLHRLLPDSGLVIFENRLFSLTDILRPFWEPYLEKRGLLSSLLDEASPLLKTHGVEPRVKKRVDETGWFVLSETTRLPLKFERGGLNVSLEGSMELRPSAAIRPIVQDFLFPNLATIVGPHELEYHAQLQAIYDFHGVTRPKVLLRFGGAFVEAKVQRFLEEQSLSPGMLSKPERELEKDLFRKGRGAELENWISRTREEIGRLFDSVGPLVSELGEDLLTPVEKKRARLYAELSSLEDLLVRRASQRDDILRGRLLRAKQAIFPDGQWQERRLTPMFFMAKYGMDFFRATETAISEVFSEAPAFHWLYLG